MSTSLINGWVALSWTLLYRMTGWNNKWKDCLGPRGAPWRGREVLQEEKEPTKHTKTAATHQEVSLGDEPISKNKFRI